jgi:hypothetical protein
MVVKRIVFDGQDGTKFYELAHQAAVMFRAGKDRRDLHASLIKKLEAAGVPKDEPTGNPDLVFYTLPAVPTWVDVEVRERDILLAAVDAIDWPGFALAKVKGVIALIENADKASA